MKFQPWKCPECGEPAHGTVETVSGKALLAFDNDGHAEYSGETKIWWEEQAPTRDAQGRVTLICENGHEWQAVMSDDDEAPRSPTLEALDNVTAALETCLAHFGHRMQRADFHSRTRLVEHARALLRHATDRRSRVPSRPSEALARVAVGIGERIGTPQGWAVFSVRGSVDGDGYQVQRIDEAGLLVDDAQAQELARATGLKLDKDGFVLDTDGQRLGVTS